MKITVKISLKVQTLVPENIGKNEHNTKKTEYRLKTDHLYTKKLCRQLVSELPENLN